MMRAETAAARPGVFVTLEGVDGAGKTTQVARLVERLEETLAAALPGLFEGVAPQESNHG